MRKKKIIALAILPAVVGLCALAAVACEDGNGNALAHTHTYSNTAWESDATYHWHAASCDHKDKVADKAVHNFAVKTVEATCAAAGYTEYECECGYIYTVEGAPALGHNLVDHAAEEATCEHGACAAYQVCTRCDYSTANYTSEKTDHVLISHAAQDPTCTEEGWATYQTCRYCDYTTYDDAKIPATGHTLVNKAGQPPVHNGDANDKDGWTDYKLCVKCGTEIGRETLTKGHTYSEEWSFEANGTMHYHAATCGHTSEKKDLEDHDYDTYGICTVCGAEENDLGFVTYSGSTVTGLGAGASGTVAIPAYHNGTKVTALKADAFKGNNTVTKIILPETITAIPVNAFYGCSQLQEVQLGSKIVSIANAAFAHCVSLTKVNVPETVQEIGAFAFQDCEMLPEINLPKKLTSLGQQAFLNCYSLREVEIPAKISTLLPNMFMNCYTLNRVILHKGLQNIDGQTFRNCTSLTHINMPETLETISQDAFRNSGLVEVELPDNMWYITTGAFADCRNLKSFTFHSGLYNLYGAWLSGCSSLESISVCMPGEGSVEATDKVLIGKLFGTAAYDGAMCVAQKLPSGEMRNFYIPASLKNVTVESGIIGENAFMNCSMIETVTIKKDVKRIMKDAFSGCTSLVSATFEVATGWRFAESALGTYQAKNLDLSGAATAARLLSRTYLKYYWKVA